MDDSTSKMLLILAVLAAVGVGGFFLWRRFQERKALALRLAGSRRQAQVSVPAQSAARFASITVINPRNQDEIPVSIR